MKNASASPRIETVTRAVEIFEGHLGHHVVGIADHPALTLTAKHGVDAMRMQDAATGAVKIQSRELLLAGEMYIPFSPLDKVVARDVGLLRRHVQKSHGVDPGIN
jgi:hypothetical protein